MTTPTEDAIAALKPFADAADAYEPDDGDNLSNAWASYFRIGDLRNARAAIARLEAEQARVRQLMILNDHVPMDILVETASALLAPAPGFREGAEAMREACVETVNGFADASGQIARAATAIRALDLPADGWRPIETAPKDGSRFLLALRCAGGNMVFEGWWAKTRFGYSSGLMELTSPDLLGWQPLPSPPAEEAGR